jgi:hypothetical protein
VNKDWEVMTQMGAKKKAEGNINLRKRDYKTLGDRQYNY